MLEEVKSIQQNLPIQPYTLPAKNKTGNPLAIACSGGSGHIVAIKAILSRYQQDNLALHQPIPCKKPLRPLLGVSIALASRINQISGIKKITGKTGLPVLPSHQDLKEAIHELREANAFARPYVDILLDVVPGGYEFAAIWNVNQRQDNKKELMKLVKLQRMNDRLYFHDISQFFLNMLNQAQANGKPYTEIISTQAMGLGGLCHAVNQYNTLHDKDLMIQVYMTDLPTRGAVHFFKALSQLSSKDQQSINLYAVGLNASVINYFFKNGCYIKQMYNIHPAANPMIRAGFMEIESLPAQDRTAIIMLGSQASNDTEKYVEQLLRFGIDKLVVFYGTNHALKDRISRKYSDCMNKMTLLSATDDATLADLMAGSHVLITRTGGLGTMMQMALNHHQQQIIMLHHADSDSHTGELKSGIPWEDENADGLIKALSNRVIKTCPNQFMQHLQMHYSR